MKNVQNFKNTLFILTRPLPLALVTKENNCLAHHAQTVVKNLCNLLVNYIFNYGTTNSTLQDTGQDRNNRNPVLYIL